MAKLDFFHTKHGFILFYNLDTAVGKGCPNQRDDVLLVQYMMMVNSQSPPGRISLSAASISGLWDTYWDGYLDYYQNEWKKAGVPTWQDRRIDPALPAKNKGRGPLHHTQYKILTLNVSYAERRPTDFSRMAEAKDCPGALRSAIRVQWVKG